MGFAPIVAGRWQLRQQFATRPQSGLDGMLLDYNNVSQKDMPENKTGQSK